MWRPTWASSARRLPRLPGRTKADGGDGDGRESETHEILLLYGRLVGTEALTYGFPNSKIRRPGRFRPCSIGYGPILGQTPAKVHPFGWRSRAIFE